MRYGEGPIEATRERKRFEIVDGPGPSYSFHSDLQPPFSENLEVKFRAIVSVCTRARECAFMVDASIHIYARVHSFIHRDLRRELCVLLPHRIEWNRIYIIYKKIQSKTFSLTEF